MIKIKNLITIILSITYVLIYFSKNLMYKKFLILILFLLLLNMIIDELINYKKTKKKIHLFIPFTSLILIIYIIKINCLI